MEKKKIQDICIVNPHLDVKLSGDMKVSFLPMTAVSTDGRIDLTKTLESEKIKNYSVFENGDVLFAKITPCMENGKGAIADNLLNGYGAGSTEFIVLRPKTDIISSKWLFLYLSQQSFRQECKQHMTGSAGQKRVQPKYLASCTVPVPPLDEQKRIVARIEELFSELDKAVETLNTTKKQLSVYRQAVLKEAFGNLTNTISMSEIAVMIDPQPSHRTPAEVAGGVPYIGVGDIDYTNNEIVFDKARKVSPLVLTEHCERYKLNNGDFIMGKIGTIGKPFRVQLPQNYALSANVILIQPDSKKIMPDFLFWQFSSPLITQQLEKGTTATSQPAFGIKKARALSIRICDYNWQAQIVENVESRLSVCEQIEKTIDQSMQKAEALRQSILKQAFEGGI